MTNEELLKVMLGFHTLLHNFEEDKNKKSDQWQLAHARVRAIRNLADEFIRQSRDIQSSPRRMF